MKSNFRPGISELFASVCRSNEQIEHSINAGALSIEVR